jgi:succinoglycan biosynthesis protein ExoA
MSDELVSVVIPACNEEEFLGACLDSVLAQDYPDLQVVVVDGASTDGTLDIVRSRMKEDHRVELVHNDRRNIPSSMNLGLAAARGRWLVRIDAHCTVPSSYVRLAVQGLREGQWAGVGGRKDGVGRTAAGRAIAVAMASRLGVGNSTYHHGTERQETEHLPFGAYPTGLVRQASGWDERLSANEDFEFDYRLRKAGHRLLFDPVPALFRQYHRYGRGKVDVAWMHPDSLLPRHIAPPLFVAYLVIALPVAVRRPRRAAEMLAPYAVIVLAEALRLSSRLATTAERTRVPVALAAMHVGWGIGFWSGARTNVGRRLRTGVLVRRGSQGGTARHQ